MTQILSSYSSEVWTLSSVGIVSPYNVTFPLASKIMTSNINTYNNKLPICFVQDNLQLTYGLVSNGIEIMSKVGLGISLDLWTFAFIPEKVLIFYQNQFLQCFSFTKERIIRKIKAGEIKKISGVKSACYCIRSSKTDEIIEWKINTGEIITIKSYDTNVRDLSLSAKGTYLAVITESFLEIICAADSPYKINTFTIENITAMTWMENENVLYFSSSEEFMKLSFTGVEFNLKSLVKQKLQVCKILEISGEIYALNAGNWMRYSEPDFIMDSIEKIDEINIGNSKAEFKNFGITYKNLTKTLCKLQDCDPLLYLSPYELDSAIMGKKISNIPIPDDLASKLILVSSLQGSIKHTLFWKVAKEMYENCLDDIQTTPNAKKIVKISERSLQNSPSNVTPTRRQQKRSVSPINKSRKSITPSRITKLQSDPKDLIQLAVDTSCLLSSTQNFPKEVTAKEFYCLEHIPTLKSSFNLVDYITSDKKSLIKKLQTSNNETELLLSCIIAGTLGKQELSKALEIICNKLNGSTGIALNLMLGNKAKAWEILREQDCLEDVAYYSKLSGKSEDFFTWVISLFEDRFGFACALQLLTAGYIASAMQVLCKIGEDRLAYWISKLFDENCKNRKEIPAEFESWFYDIGPPRFKSKMTEEIQSLYLKYDNKNKNT